MTVGRPDRLDAVAAAQHPAAMFLEAGTGGVRVRRVGSGAPEFLGHHSAPREAPRNEVCSVDVLAPHAGLAPHHQLLLSLSS